MLVLLSTIGCKETPPTLPLHMRSIELEAVHVGTMDVTLKITLADVAQASEVMLTRNSNTVYVFRPSVNDTVVIDPPLVPELWPSSTYTYRAYLLHGKIAIDSSEALVLTTGDSSSHAIQWSVDTVGTGYSILKDVAVVGDSIWAVGELYRRDSAGQIDRVLHNLASWNGTTWNIRRVPYNYQGQQFFSPIQSVFAHHVDDILLGGNGLLRWNGQQFIEMPIPSNVWGSVLVNKIWQREDQVYLVGDNGSIAYLNGSTWQAQSSGTSVRLTDIWGTPDGSEVWACGFNDSNGGSVVLRHVNGTWQTLWDRLAPPRPPYIYASELSSLWTSGNGEFVAVGGRFYHHSLYNLNIVHDEWIRGTKGYRVFQMRNWAYRARGTARNDIWLVGDDAMIWHWNGSTWHRYEELTNANDRLYGLAVSSNMLVAVGTRYNGIYRSGLVIIGRR